MNGYKLKVNYTTVSGLKMAMDGSEIDEIQMQAEQIAEDIRAKIERQIIRQFDDLCEDLRSVIKPRESGADENNASDAAIHIVKKHKGVDKQAVEDLINEIRNCPDPMNHDIMKELIN